MLVLSREDVQSVLTMNDALAAVEQAFKEFALGNVDMPVRSSVAAKKHDGIMLTMPAYIGGEFDALGQKIATIYPHNPEWKKLPTVLATIQLLDPTSGECFAIMDGTFLTAMRTGAVSGVASKYLSRPDSNSVFLFGAGVQAETQLEAVSVVRRLRAARVYDKDKERAEKFCEHMSRKLRIEITPTENPREGVRDCDIVICATTSHTPVLKGEWLRLGTHINAIGAHTLDGREVDTLTIKRSRVFVDSLTAALAESGDIIIPLNEKEITRDHIVGELGEVLLGKKDGRRARDDITFFKSLGLAIQDVSTAKIVYEKAMAMRKGTTVKT